MGYELRVFLKRTDDSTDLNVVNRLKALWELHAKKSSNEEMPLYPDPLRIDTYLDFGEPSVGLKLRHGSKLELKLRRDSSSLDASSSSQSSSQDSQPMLIQHSVPKLPTVEHWTRQHPDSIYTPYTASNVVSTYFPSESTHPARMKVREKLIQMSQEPNGEKNDIFASGVFKSVEISKKRVQMTAPFNWCSKIYKGHAEIEQTDLEINFPGNSDSFTPTVSSPPSSDETVDNSRKPQQWRSIAIEGKSEAAIRAMWAFLFPDPSSYANIIDGGYPGFVIQLLKQD